MEGLWDIPEIQRDNLHPTSPFETASVFWSCASTLAQMREFGRCVVLNRRKAPVMGLSFSRQYYNLKHVEHTDLLTSHSSMTPEELMCLDLLMRVKETVKVQVSNMVWQDDVRGDCGRLE